MIELQHVSHRFSNGTQALSNVSLNLDGGTFTALIGPSGAGKSTLMRVINGLVRPSQGRVTISGHDLTAASGAQVRLARREIGMVFQQFNLVRRLSALDNVLLGRLGYRAVWRSALKAYSQAEVQFALHLLDRVGLADQAWQRADTLSGGQQQRVGIARALAQEPKVILADEPISALDPKSAEQVMHILRSIHEDDGLMVIANLHFLGTVRDYAGRVIGLQQGQVMFDGTAAELTDAAAHQLYYAPQLPPTPAAPPPVAAVSAA
ncbi:phosphonate ABC transporter ATP-binding protein [Deinococcus oregonensis]|uniref:Phosphonate ABC transporter ATP-binding protein n=1 Tax=Deinococcus oregonensis TaxID=1805970 RepID=A0ABV6AVR1_9DEIO